MLWFIGVSVLWYIGILVYWYIGVSVKSEYYVPNTKYQTLNTAYRYRIPKLQRFPYIWAQRPKFQHGTPG